MPQHPRRPEWKAIDDVKGGELEVEDVMGAKDEEMSYVFAREVYKPSSLQMCREITGRAPLATGWVDTNKGDRQKPNHRSRLVAKEVKAI